MNIHDTLNCISCIFIIWIFNVCNLWGIITVYVYSYLRRYDRSLTLNSMNLVFFWITLAKNTGIQFGLMCAYKFGFSLTIIVSGLLAGVSFYCSSFAKSLLQFIVTFAVAGMFFQGITYLISFDRAFKLFPKHNELISGIITAIYGVALLVSGQVVYFLINPDNQEIMHDQDFYPTSVSDKLPSALQTLSLLFCCLVLIAYTLYNEKSFVEVTPEKVQVKNLVTVNEVDHAEQTYVFEPQEGLEIDCPNNSSEKQQKTKKIDTSNQVTIEKSQNNLNQLNVTISGNINHISNQIKFSDECQSMQQGFLSFPFIATFIIVFLISNFGTMMIANFKPYGQLQIKDDSFLTLVGTVASMLNGVSGIIWGPIQAHIHFKYNIYAILLINTICAFLFPSLSYSKVCYFILTCLANICHGGVFVVLPIAIVSVFGKTYGTRMLGIFYQGMTLASLFSYFLLENVSSWTTVFYIQGGCSALCLILVTISPMKVKWSILERTK